MVILFIDHFVIMNSIISPLSNVKSELSDYSTFMNCDIFAIMNGIIKFGSIVGKHYMNDMSSSMGQQEMIP